MKGRGNQLFASDNYTAAIQHYEDAILLLDKSDHPVAATNEMSKVYANMAECHLRLENYTAADKAATMALSCDGRNVKASFRRARARMELGDLRGAINDITASNNSRIGTKG